MRILNLASHSHKNKMLFVLFPSAIKTGKGVRDINLECFSTSDNNVRVSNGTLILTAIHRPSTEMRLFPLSKNFTSGRLTTKYGTGFSHGSSFVISARLPKGKALTPSIWLRPGYTDHDNCKYEEIEIMSARGEKSSNLIFSASFGRYWNAVVSKRIEKHFRGVNFSQDFHEFALVWKLQPPRIDWYLDGIQIFSVGTSTHFYSDWILSDETNVPCSVDKSLFKQPLQLTLSLGVGGNREGGNSYENNPLSLDEAMAWEKPTFEIDWVQVYQMQ